MLLFSNGLTIRPDTSILYSRIGILTVLYGFIATLNNFHITYLDKGISLYGGLFNVTSICEYYKQGIRTIYYNRICANSYFCCNGSNTIVSVCGLGLYIFVYWITKF